MNHVSGFWAGALECAGVQDLSDLAELVGGWHQLDHAGPAELKQIGIPSERIGRWLATPSLCTMGDAITLADERYPARLRQVPNAPAVLFVEGNWLRLHEYSVAVVGTRRCTPYGVAVARHLGTALSTNGVCVVSGLARGIDTHAHRGALRDGRTVAVLGHGLAHTSPASNRRLRHEIVQAGGAVVSSWPDDLAPRPWTFPVRNKWIAGLSVATVVVEAPLKSGALITATEAAAIGRDVYAVPHALGQPGASGCLQLLAYGAAVVQSVEGLVETFGGRSEVPNAPWLEVLYKGGSAHEAAREAQIPVTDLLVRLARMEVEGKVVRLPGQRYAPGRGSS